MTQEEKDIKAAEIVVKNSYLKGLHGDRQLTYIFFYGMNYGRTNEMPESLLDDKNFINGK